MATFNVYDNVSGTNKSVTVDVDSAVVNGGTTGSQAYYITVSTSAKDPRGESIPAIVLTDGDISGDITTAVKAAIVELFRYASGVYLDETSSSSTNEMSSSSQTNTQVTSGMSSSSSSTRRKGSSSSVSSESHSSASLSSPTT